jgi:hypothetical protein
MRSAAIAKPRSQVRLSDKRRLIGDGSAVLQAEHAIAISEALIAMCNHHHGRAGLEIEHGLDDFTLRRHVDRARCFIKYEQIRPPEHGAGKTQTLRSPPEMSVPRSPSTVSSPAGKPATNSPTPAVASASQISASLACGLAHDKLRRNAHQLGDPRTATAVKSGASRNGDIHRVGTATHYMVQFAATLVIIAAQIIIAYN